MNGTVLENVTKTQKKQLTWADS